MSFIGSNNPFSNLNLGAFRQDPRFKKPLPPGLNDIRQNVQPPVPRFSAQAPLGELLLSMAALYNASQALDTADQLLLLRNLLKLPKDFMKLLALLSQDPATAPTDLLNTLLNSGQPLPAQRIQEILKAQLSDAQNKLLTLFQTNSTDPSGLTSNTQAEQLKHFMESLTKLSTQINSPKAMQEQVPLLETVIALYAPLHPPQAFRLELAHSADMDKNGKESPSTETVPVLTVYIDTLMLGRFKFLIIEKAVGDWQAIVSHEDKATPHLNDWIAHLNKDFPLRSDWLNRLEFLLQDTCQNPEQNQKSGKKLSTAAAPSNHSVGADGLKTKQSVALHAAPTKNNPLPVGTVQFAYCLIQTLFTLDNTVKKVSHRQTTD
ncbi:MAG: hypothetical protein AAGI66_05290 [Cyanobacteria bacterium P01_H01_bin.74]